jgi:predicted nucleic acid-binding Zn ribbon protein
VSVLVEYRCDSCGASTDRFVATPIPSESPCGACGASARRRFGGAGLLGVKPKKAGRDRLERERAEKAPSAGGAAAHHHHDHHHGHGHNHSSGHDHPHPHPH